MIKYTAISFALILCSLTAVAAENSITIPKVRLTLKKPITRTTDDAVHTIHISREQIATSPAINVYEVLQQQSVIQLTNNSGISNQTVVSFRGFGDNASANSLILIDGFPLSNPSLLAPDANFLSLADIESIDIQQGSQGTLWGDQAVGGVINIITRHPKKLSLAAQVGLGNFGQRIMSGSFNHKFENGWFLKGYAVTKHTDNYRRNNEQEDTSVFFQTGFDYRRGSISLNWQDYTSRIGLPTGLTPEQYAINPRQSNTTNHYVSYQTHAYQFLNKHELTGNWLLETRVAIRDIDGAGYFYRTFERHESQTDMMPKLSGKLGNNKLILGYHLQHSTYRLQNILVRNEVTAMQQSLYGQITIPLGHTWEMILGARAARQNSEVHDNIKRPSSSNQSVFVSEQSLVYRPNHAWKFFLRRDGNFSFPKANQQTWTPDGSASLLPQVGASYETGLSWVTANHTTQLSLYQLDLKHELAFDPNQTVENPFGSYRNLSKTQRRGLTVAEDWQITKKLGLAIQLNYVDARFKSGKFSGNQIPAVSALHANTGLRYQLTPNWQAQYNIFYTGNRYPSEDDANASTKLPGYWLNSLGIQYQRAHIRAGFKVENLANCKYPIYTLYSPETKMNTYYPGAGRTWLFTLGMDI